MPDCCLQNEIYYYDYCFGLLFLHFKAIFNQEKNIKDGSKHASFIRCAITSRVIYLYECDEIEDKIQNEDTFTKVEDNNTTKKTFTRIAIYKFFNANPNFIEIMNTKTMTKISFGIRAFETYPEMKGTCDE